MTLLFQHDKQEQDASVGHAVLVYYNIYLLNNNVTIITLPSIKFKWFLHDVFPCVAIEGSSLKIDRK